VDQVFVIVIGLIYQWLSGLPGLLRPQDSVGVEATSSRKTRLEIHGSIGEQRQRSSFQMLWHQEEGP
jgi:hypothetical protein